MHCSGTPAWVALLELGACSRLENGKPKDWSMPGALEKDGFSALEPVRRLWRTEGRRTGGCLEALEMGGFTGLELVRRVWRTEDLQDCSLPEGFGEGKAHGWVHGIGSLYEGSGERRVHGTGA